MSINFGLRRESKEDEEYHVPGFVNRLNIYLDETPAQLVEVEPGIEYPEGNVSIEPIPSFTEDFPEDVTEEVQTPKVRDNGLGIMVVDYPEIVPTISDNQDEAESVPEFTSERNQYKTSISYKKLAAGGLGKIVKAAKKTGSAVTNKYYGANTVIADAFNGIHSVGEKLSKLESKTNRSKVIKGLGGLAVLGAVSYAAYRGISLLETSHTHQAAHEAAQQLLPAKAPQHHEVAQTIPTPPKAMHQPAEVASAAPAQSKALSHNPPSHHPKALASHASNKLANYNLKDWTWNLAHRVRPGHENNVITKALRSYQHITGNQARLVQQGNTSFIEVNNHVVNSSQMEAINRLVVRG
jgi:hypothetical protein